LKIRDLNPSPIPRVVLVHRDKLRRFERVFVFPGAPIFRPFFGAFLALRFAGRLQRRSANGAKESAFRVDRSFATRAKGRSARAAKGIVGF
jgi:hypothetical protein